MKSKSLFTSGSNSDHSTVTESYYCLTAVPWPVGNGLTADSDPIHKKCSENSVSAKIHHQILKAVSDTP